MRSQRHKPRRSRDLNIVHEDEHLIAVNKPAGVLSVRLERNPGVPSVSEQLEDHFRSRGKKRPFVVHRIDQDSSGLVVFAKDASTQDALTRQFRHREPERVYIAVVSGQVEPSSGTWRDHLVWDRRALIQKIARATDSLAEEAISQYRVLEHLRGASLLEVHLVTGRRNQIRIQAAYRGYPLVGERRYVTTDKSPRSIRFARQALHAWRLSFRHPADGREMTLEAPLPPDLEDLLTRLRPRSERRR